MADSPTSARLPAIAASEFAKRTSRLLTTRYLVAIAAVALLSIAGQVLVQVALSRQALDAKVINLAGRQRNYSQALCKGILAVRSLDAAGAAKVWQETGTILGLWVRVHRGLQDGLVDPTHPELELPANRSAVVAARFAELQPEFADLERHIRGAVEHGSLPDDQVADLLATQRRFLDRMEAVVSQLQKEAGGRVFATRVLEASLFAILAVVLVFEVFVIFRPTVRRIRHEITAREHAEEIAIEREVAEVSGRLERRIGQDLHDGLGQLLTGISFQAKALERRLKDGPGAAEAADIASQVAQAIAQTRSLARMLHPVEADAESLGAGIHELGAIAERVFNVQAVVQWDDDLPVPPTPHSVGEPDTAPSMHLYRIAQEAVSNAIRHGGATHLWITGARDGDHVELLIVDDGRGFDPPDAAHLHQHRSGMGLRIMAFRAERIGATFAIQRRDEGGMRVMVRWPVA